MKIVESGFKIDLHIHSIYSYGKDKRKVSFNTIDNLGVLVDKLNENKVQICAITDHDIFNYSIYKALKQYEKDDHSSIAKVFPGIEFSVEFVGENGPTILHVISIFTDEDDDKIKSIESVILDDQGNIKYDRSNAFSEEKFISILRNIGLDTILIVHQKSSLSSKKTYKSDVKTVGDERFFEFIYTDYFEAFEFKNRKNEVFNKNFLNEKQLSGDVRFITGSDCHDWRYYPKETKQDSTDFVFTYVKCLPSFRGLVMAITDHRRIKTVNSFFNPTEKYINNLDITIDGKKYIIPLSRGINVIIGDNSIGKSLLLHKITNYRKQQEDLLSKSVIKGYEKYLMDNNIDIQTSIPSSEILKFDMQGEIRDKFEQNEMYLNDFLKAYYPAPIMTDAYREKINRKLNTIYKYLKDKYEIEHLEEHLGRFKLLDEDIVQAESLTFIGAVSKDTKKVEGFSGISASLNNVKEELETIMDDVFFEEDDKTSFKMIISNIQALSKKYEKKKILVENENTKIALYQDVIDKFKQRYQQSVSDTQKKLSTYRENVDTTVDDIVNIMRLKNTLVRPSLQIEKETICIQTERVHDYEFNSRTEITEIDENYIERLFSSEMKKGIVKSVLDMTQKELYDSLLRVVGSEAEVLNELKRRIDDQLSLDLSNKYTITQAGKDRTLELSSGFNSQIYFDILSYETKYEGMYIIDQPEDNISQKAIRDYLLDRFKAMGENRQIIMVTHRPQFIVNLDVDNVIFIGKKNGHVYIQSGALEYRDDNYNILDIISENVEGGLDALRRRWKRYEKNNSV